MNDDRKFFTGFILGMAIIVIGVITLIATDIPMWVFLVIVVAGVAVTFLPLSFMRNMVAESDGADLRIRAPFVDLTIPLSDIQAVEFRDSLKSGMRTFGYAGIRRRFGDFCNDDLGYYTLSADVSIPAFIVVRHHNNRIVAFNKGDEAQTLALYNQLRSGTHCSEGVMKEGVKAVPSRGITKKKVALVVGAITVVSVIAILAILMCGHVDVSMDDQYLHVDATMVNEDIAYADIDSAEFRENMDYGMRRAGYAGMGILSGSFENSEFGKYTLAVHKSSENCIVVHHHGTETVFNCPTDADTQAFYADLCTHLAP